MSLCQIIMVYDFPFLFLSLNSYWTDGNQIGLGISPDTRPPNLYLVMRFIQWITQKLMVGLISESYLVIVHLWLHFRGSCLIFIREGGGGGVEGDLLSSEDGIITYNAFAVTFVLPSFIRLSHLFRFFCFCFCFVLCLFCFFKNCLIDKSWICSNLNLLTIQKKGENERGWHFFTFPHNLPNFVANSKRPRQRCCLWFVKAN